MAAWRTSAFLETRTLVVLQRHEEAYFTGVDHASGRTVCTRLKHGLLGVRRLGYEFHESMGRRPPEQTRGFRDFISSFIISTGKGTRRSRRRTGPSM
jgi:hypothetical protein